MRKSLPSPAKKGNVAKADSYREAKARIKSAKEHHFYIEATAIIESIISDRILSYLHGAHDFPLKTKNGWDHSLNNLTEKVREYDELLNDEGENVWNLIDTWRRKRNKVVHNLVRSDPGTPTLLVDDFLEKARESCETGEALANAVVNWNKRAKRRAEKAQSE